MRIHSTLILAQASYSLASAIPAFDASDATAHHHDIAAQPVGSPLPKVPSPTLVNAVAGRSDNGYSGVNPTDPPTAFRNALDDLEYVSATDAPAGVAAASKTLSALLTSSTATTVEDVVNSVSQIVEAGLTFQNVGDWFSFFEGLITGDNSFTNLNFQEPYGNIYPQADYRDAPYDLPEEQLRAAIHIPSSFSYGQGAQPIILVPGTGSTGYLTFVGNYIPLLQNSGEADPVWLNIPDFLLDDAQTNAEYVAYAINYISDISNRNVAVLSWSQGGLDCQWAYKYWPSTRAKVTDQISISPDYHGTTSATLLDKLDVLPLPPSILQQKYDSKFVATLRSDGGDSAYVPTTTIYSGFLDLVVQPQQGTNASAFLLDQRNVGVSNNEFQTVCAGQPAGTFYSHEGALLNPLGFALLQDALAHDGPGQASRLDLGRVCSTYLTPGLDLTDFLLTEDTLVGALVAVLGYQESTTVEPPIRPYALRR